MKIRGKFTIFDWMLDAGCWMLDAGCWMERSGDPDLSGILDTRYKLSSCEDLLAGAKIQDTSAWCLVTSTNNKFTISLGDCQVR